MDREGVTIYRGDYIHESAKIGHGTRIGAGHDIGKDVVIGMGAMIRKDVDPFQVVVEDGSRTLYDRTVYDEKRKQYESDKVT
ncbi:unnamed protein product [marine sediment metagenome]|uniref:Uncharacterized protein n=1 Tax=marine sediment metagenome TaxID=412755 RepID=X1CB86_9ZZZZ